MKKAIFIDTNSVNEDGSCHLHEIIAKHLKLSPGEIVTAYQDSDSWDAEIVFSNGIWGVILSENSITISDELAKGHSDGRFAGILLEMAIVEKALDTMNIPNSLLQKIKRKLNLQ